MFNSRSSYIPNRDGSRFLVNVAVDTAGTPINDVLNWTTGLS